MKILIIQPWYGANSARYITDAMELCDAHIFRVGPRYGEHLGMVWGDSEMPKIDIELPKEIDWNMDFLIDRAAREFRFIPDMVFISEENYRNQIKNTEKIPSVFYSCDGWEKNYRRADMVKATFNYTNHPRGIRQQPQKELPKGWSWLPGAALPSVHRYLGLERDIDFVLLATMYTERPRIIKEIADAGFITKVGQVKTNEYVKIYNKSLCTLHNPGWFEVKWKWWEAAAMGCLLISSYTPPLDWLNYRPWVHYVPVPAVETNDGPWPDSKKAIEIIRDIKNNRPFFQQIADAAREHTIKHHSYYNRCKTVFIDLGFKEVAEKAQEKIDGAWAEHLGQI